MGVEAREKTRNLAIWGDMDASNRGGDTLYNGSIPIGHDVYDRRYDDDGEGSIVHVAGY